MPSSVMSIHSSSDQSSVSIAIGADRTLRTICWPHLLELPQLRASTIPGVGRRFFLYVPDVILKLGTDEGEATMTELAHKLLGPVAPRLDAFVSIVRPRADEGILITRLPGTPLVELWPRLSSTQRAIAKTSLTALLVHMRAPSNRLSYYGRPGAQPYITQSEFGPNDAHDFCRSRVDWDESRVRALRTAVPEIGVQEGRVRELERVQCETGAYGAKFVDSPVITHGDLSDRNILLDPTALTVTGLIDWELANVAPAYFEYAVACLMGGHDPEWRKELLEILREVLRIECEREVALADSAVTPPLREDEEGKRKSTNLFEETLAAWDAFVDVERYAQGFSDNCYWTFENRPKQPRAADGSSGVHNARVT